MQTLTQSFTIKQSPSAGPGGGLTRRPGKMESLILLDIETTGLSADMSAIFMIGCAYFENGHLRTVQWLADSLELKGEQEVLMAFSRWFNERLSSEDTLYLITYNGHNFDLPFLKIRYSQCGLEFPLDYSSIQGVLDTPNPQIRDFYRELLPLKPLWPTANMKLKSMSQWLGYHYSNAPEGRRLIKTYHEYIKTKDSEILNLLFLHNADDLRALCTLLPLYNYLLFFHGAYTIASANISDGSTLYLRLKPENYLPAPVSYAAFDSRLSVTASEVLLQTQIHPQGLRYYYTDIKNYVYLPEEDYALHKSMTAYIDKAHWQKARLENCYTWFSPDDTFLRQTSRQKEYVQMIFRLFGFLR